MGYYSLPDRECIHFFCVSVQRLETNNANFELFEAMVYTFGKLIIKIVLQKTLSRKKEGQENALLDIKRDVEQPVNDKTYHCQC